MKQSYPWQAISAVILPLLLIGAWWYRIDRVVNGGIVVALPVAGYDPRDLLSGHYLSYRVQYTPADPCLGKDTPQDLCLCVSANTVYTDATPLENPVTWTGVCSEKPTEGCAHYLRGSCANYRFEAGIERFYFPESYIPQLKIVPPNASILVSVNESGLAVVREFLVEGTPLLEWARQHPSPQAKTVP